MYKDHREHLESEKRAHVTQGPETLRFHGMPRMRADAQKNQTCRGSRQS